MKKKVNIKLLLLLFLGLLYFSCSKSDNGIIPEQPDELGKPLIELSLSGTGTEFIKGEVFKLIVSFEAEAGIKTIHIIENEVTIEKIEPAGRKVTEEYIIEQTIDESYQDGDEIHYEFKLTDTKENVEVSKFTLVILEEALIEPTFSITDLELGGITYKSIRGNINIDTLLLSGYKYILDGKVKVEPEFNLRIQEGTIIYAPEDAELVISSQAKLIAEGTKENPIIFTSINDIDGIARRGDWIGIHINGLSQVSEVDPIVEAQTSPYGGSNSDDNSGVMKYVRIEYAGAGSVGSGALNLNAVGSNTTIENINVYESDRNAVNVRGGTANMKYLVIDNPFDKGLYWEAGYKGFVQHVAAFYRTEPRAAYTLIEGRYTSESAPIFSNFTITTIGTEPVVNSRGIRFRGTLGKIYNTIITNTERGVRLDAGNDIDVTNGDLVLANSLIWNNVPSNYQGIANRFIDEPEFENSDTPIEIDGYIGVGTTGAKPANTINSWFDDVSHIGAVPADNDWTIGWTKQD